MKKIISIVVGLISLLPLSVSASATWSQACNTGGASSTVPFGNAGGTFTCVSPSLLGIPSYWTLSGSSLYNNSGTNVGVNVTSPAYAIDVATSSGDLLRLTSSTQPLPKIVLQGSDRMGTFFAGTIAGDPGFTVLGGLDTRIDNNGLTLRNGSETVLYGSIKGDSSNNLVISSLTSGKNIVLSPTSGNVGINTASPSSLLTINGSGQSDLEIDTSNPYAGIKFSGTNGDSFLSSFVGGALDVNSGGLVLSNDGALDFYSAANNFHRGSIGPDGNANLNINQPQGGKYISLTGGNVGIATTSPMLPLSLNGNMIASSTATSTFQGGSLNLTTAAGHTGCFAINGTCLISGSLAGPNMAVQYNNAGAAGGDSNLTYDGAGTLTVGTQILVGTSITVPQVTTDTLFNNSGNGNHISLAGSQLFDFSNLPSLEWTGRVTYDTSTSASLDWQNRELLTNGATVFNWASASLYDVRASHLAIDGNNRILYAADGTTPLIDFSNVVGGAPYYFSSNKLIGDGSGLTGIVASPVIGGAVTSATGNHLLYDDGSALLHEGPTWDGTNLGISGNMSLSGTFTDSASGVGSSGQLLMSTSAATQWQTVNQAYINTQSSATPVGDGTYALSNTLGGSITFQGGIVTAFTPMP